MANDFERKSIAQLICAEEYGLSLRRVIVPVEGQGGGHTVVRVPSLSLVPACDPFWWVLSVHGGSAKK